MVLQDRLIDHETIKLRIGIHIGDVTHEDEDEDIFGNGVNVAARLEANASPGGLAISDAVWSSLDGTFAPSFDDAGHQTLKNIAEPVRVWTRGPKSKGIESTPMHPQRHKPAIAVLPFDNLSSDPEQDSLADGLVEEIITALSRFSSLLVISRSSSSIYKNRSTEVPDIARELCVNYLVLGSVRRAGERLRVAVQLVDGETGGNVRAERFDRAMADLFDVQDELTLAIVAAVAPEINAREIARVKHVPTSNLTAWDLYQRALSEFHTYSPAGVDAAKTLAMRATEADPAMAAPCSLLARIHCSDHLKAANTDGDTNLADALRWARCAIACDSSSDEALGTLGFALTLNRLQTEAIDALERAVELNSNNGYTRMHLAMTLLSPGVERPAEALEHIQMALRISPADPFGWAWTSVACTACLQLGENKQAAEYFSRCRNYPHHDWKVFLGGALCDVLNGADASAIQLINRAESCTAQVKLTLAMARHNLPQLFSIPHLEAGCRRLFDLGLAEL